VKFDYVAYCTGVNRCNILVNNKEVKRFVDVAPPWGEPHISGVPWFSLCCIIYVMNLLSAWIMMCNR
jgi:hypothetical protein